jgi:hypothetical protein
MAGFCSHSVGNVVIPSDELRFFRGVGLNQQAVFVCRLFSKIGHAAIPKHGRVKSVGPVGYQDPMIMIRY